MLRCGRGRRGRSKSAGVGSLSNTFLLDTAVWAIVERTRGDDYMETVSR